MSSKLYVLTDLYCLWEASSQKEVSKKVGVCIFGLRQYDIFTSEISTREIGKIIKRPESGQQKQSQKIGRCRLQGECRSKELE